MDTPTIQGPGIDDRSPDQQAEAGREVDRFVGKVLANRYKIHRRIGVGGFGAVFEATDTKIGKRVAVKVLARDLVNDQAMLARFHKEAEAASKVGHENIIDITDFDRTTEGSYFLVMEYLEGIDLGSILRSGERLPLARILAVMIQVCRALGAAHGKGIVHRDLKPGNIFLTSRTGQADFVKLLDFGISKFMETDDESCRLTKTGQIIGTPLYMSPEQALGEEDLDHRVDIYSLGVILYELATGQPPFTAVNYLGIIAQHASDPPTPPSRVRPDLEIPPALETIILKAMAKRPEDRFSTMAEMEHALIRTLASIDPASAVTFAPDATPPSILTSTTGVSQRRLTGTRPVPVWALLLVTAVAGGAVALWAGYRQPAPQRPAVPAKRARPPGETVGRPTRAAHAKEAGGSSAETARDGAVLSQAVTIVVDSVPRGADVRDDRGELLGRTPLTLRWRRSGGPREIHLRRRDYRSASREIVPDRDQEVTIPLRPRTRGSLPDDPKGWGHR